MNLRKTKTEIAIMSCPPAERDRGWVLGAKPLSFFLIWKWKCLCFWPRWSCQHQEKLEGADYPAVLEVRDVLLVPIKRKSLSLGAPLRLVRWM